MTAELEQLVKEYGPELVLQACKNMLNPTKQEVVINADSVKEALTTPRAVRDIPQKYMVIYPNSLTETADNLDVIANKLMGQVQANYEKRAELLFRLKQIETEISLKEAEAFMQTVNGEAQVGDKMVKLANTEMRDAYRRQYSAELRTQRANIEAELAKLDVQREVDKEQRENALTTGQILIKKAALQTALLNFLGGNG